MHFSKPCKHNNHGHCLWCEVEKENMSEYFRLISGYCEHGKKGKCIHCECEKIAQETEKTLKEVSDFIDKTGIQLNGYYALNEKFKEYQEKKMTQEYGAKNRIGKWL